MPNAEKSLGVYGKMPYYISARYTAKNVKKKMRTRRSTEFWAKLFFI